MFNKKDDKKDASLSARTELSALGEFGLIDHLTKNFAVTGETTVKGVGDDAAVIDTKGDLLLLSTDLLIEGVHFDLTYMPLRHLGYKAVVVNVSDIAAMNGIPRQITVSIAVSNRFPVEALDELYTGIKLACEKYKVDLVGGDTSSSTKGLMLSVTVTGTAKSGEITYRNGAKDGDLLCVTGDLGGAYAGLLLLEREKQVFRANPNMQPELDGYEYVLGRQLKPEARTDLRTLLSGAGVKPTAMIDISDGLASEVMHICKQSHKGCRIYEEKIPLSDETRKLAMEFKIAPSICALSGGEDYELLFTISQADYEKIRDFPEISVVGHLTKNEEEKILITSDGKLLELKAQGWDAMREK
ncbi:MAG: thiamine-phosphate kinase [Syntrophothermus sp.]